MHSGRQQRTVLVNGQSPSNQRLSSQAVRDEVEARLAGMINEAELQRAVQAADREQQAQDRSKYGAAAATGGGPLMATSSSVGHHGISSTAMVASPPHGSAGISSNLFRSHKNPNALMHEGVMGHIAPSRRGQAEGERQFQVTGTPQAVLRQCIKHFLCHPQQYGTHVHAMLQDELQYVLSLWATSPIESTTTSSSSTTKPPRGLIGERFLPKPKNVVEENFFDRLIREATERQLQLDAESSLPQLEYAAASTSPLSIVPRPPPETIIVSGGGGLSASNTMSHTGGQSARGGGSGSGTVMSDQASHLASLGNFEVNTLRRQVKSLEQFNTVLGEHLRAKTLELKDAMMAVADSRQSMEELEGSVMAAKRSKEAVEAELHNVKTSLDEQLLKATNFRDEEEDKRRTTEVRLAEMRAELGQVYLQWKNAQNQMLASQKELDRSVEECEQLRSDLEGARLQIAKAQHIVYRRNRTLSLMQDLLLHRRESHGKLQQCVRELETFAGSGTLTELYLGSDPAWSSFLFYRLHRHVFHVSNNATATTSPVAVTALAPDTALFVPSTEGGSWRVSGFSIELIYRLLLSNDGDFTVVKDTTAKGWMCGITASYLAIPAGSAPQPAQIAESSPFTDFSESHESRPMQHTVGACVTLQWGTAPYLIHCTVLHQPTKKQGGAQQSNQGGLDLNVSLFMSIGGKTAIKSRSVLTVASLVVPLPQPIIKRLNVPATLLAAQHKAALAAGDTSAAEVISQALPPPYKQTFEQYEDTLKLRRSDVRLILYVMWKERYLQYVDYFQRVQAARSAAAAASQVNIFPKASSTSPLQSPSPLPESTVTPLASFITFLYQFLALRFPLPRNTTGGGGKGSNRRGSKAPVNAQALYTNPMDVDATVVRTAVGDDRVAYCYLRAPATMASDAAIIAPLDGKYLPSTTAPTSGKQQPAATTHVAPPTVDSIVALSPVAREVLLTIMHYAFEYKEVDSDFRLFYLVSNQLLPEAAAINFFAMTEAIYRDCDETVVRQISEDVVQTHSGNAQRPKVKAAKHGPSVSSLINNATYSPSKDPPLITVKAPGGGRKASGEQQGVFKELYQRIPVTKVELRNIDSTSTTFGFDGDSSSEDDEAAITTDIVNEKVLSALRSPMHSNLDGFTATAAAGGGGARHVLAGLQSKRSLDTQLRPTSAPFTSAFDQDSRTKSALLQRNGLISLHQFLSILERHCFATYQLVKIVATGGSHSEWEQEMADRLSPVSPLSPQKSSSSRAAALALQALVRKNHSDESSSEEEEAPKTIDDPVAELIRTYREEARQRLNDDATNADASPLMRIGYVPLTTLQAQRLKFSLSLDQPSSVVKYASLFQPDTGAARPSHFYDELLMMVMDHHLAIQEVLMEEIILPSCSCRGGPSSGIEAPDVLASCEGDISVPQLLLHARRWVGSVQPPAPPVSSRISPPISPRNTSSLTPTAAAASAAAAAAMQQQPALHSVLSMRNDPLCIDIAARRLVLQLCEACPPDNTSGQFVDTVVTLSALSKVAKYETSHPELSASLEHFISLPLHHLAAKLRTTMLVFETDLDDAAATGGFMNQQKEFMTRRSSNSSLSQDRSRHNQPTSPTASTQSPRHTNQMSVLSFAPLPRELLIAFRNEMEAACSECENRINTQRALHNNLVKMIPDPENPNDVPLMVSVAAKRWGETAGKLKAMAGKGISTTAIDANPVPVIVVPKSGNASPISFRSFYEEDSAASSPNGKNRISSLAAAAANAAASRARSKSITDAVRNVFDTARTATLLTPQQPSLTHVQETKQIPMELGLSTMLKRQLATTFPAALLPTLSDLHLYHRALMTALLKPMDDAAAAAGAVANSALSVPLPAAMGRSPGNQSLLIDRDGSPTRRSSTMMAATSFALKRVTTEDMNNERTVQEKQKESAPPLDNVQVTATGMRRRLGSVAMGMYASLT